MESSATRQTTKKKSQSSREEADTALQDADTAELSALSVLANVRRVTLPDLSLRYYAYQELSGVSEIPLSLASEHELIFVLDGEVTYIINGETCCAHEGDCLYTTPGEPYCRMESNQAAVLLILRFWEEKHGGAAASAAEGFPHKIPCGYDQRISETIRMMENIVRTGTPNQTRNCLAALQVLLSQMQDFLLCYSDNEYVREIKRYIFAHYREGVSLSELAETVGLHPVYCAKIFKRSEGITIGTYINKLRILRAAAQLESAVETSDVAEDLGLSEFYFSRWFRQMTGVAPTEYRDALRAGYVRGAAVEKDMGPQ